MDWYGNGVLQVRVCMWAATQQQQTENIPKTTETHYKLLCIIDETKRVFLKSWLISSYQMNNNQ